MRNTLLILLTVCVAACGQEQSQVRGEERYQFRSYANTHADGRSFLNIQVRSQDETVFTATDQEMIPGSGGHFVSESSGRKIEINVEYDLEGRGAFLNYRIARETKVLAEGTGFVERPAPDGYVRALMIHGVSRPVVLDVGDSPVVPAIGRRHGVFRVDARINANGTVDGVTVLNREESDEVAQQVADSVRKWRFLPATDRKGTPVAVASVINVGLRP